MATAVPVSAPDYWIKLVEKLDAADERRRKRLARREIAFSVVTCNQGRRGEEPPPGPEAVAEDDPRRPVNRRTTPADARARSGYSFHFTFLIGIDHIWCGDPVREGRCACCGGRKLAVDELCIACCRSGQDMVIPRPSKDEIRKCERAEAERRGELGPLKGGR